MVSCQKGGGNNACSARSQHPRNLLCHHPWFSDMFDDLITDNGVEALIGNARVEHIADNVDVRLRIDIKGRVTLRLSQIEIFVFTQSCTQIQEVAMHHGEHCFHDCTCADEPAYRMEIHTDSLQPTVAGMKAF